MSDLALKPALLKGADLLLVGHGVRGPCAPASVGPHKDLVRQLREQGGFNEIRWGYLTCEPYVEDVIASFNSEAIYVLPMLMCDGYFSRNTIPERLQLSGVTSHLDNGQDIIQCLPVGLSTKMADLMVDHMVSHCTNTGLNPKETTVVVIGHGSSKDNASRLAVSMQVEHIAHAGKFKAAHDAYLEEFPDLPSVLKAIRGPALVMGYFANCGKHAMDDITKLMLESGTDATYLGPVGALPDVASVVLECVEKSGGPQGQ